MAERLGEFGVRKPVFAVLGLGNGGQAMGGHLAQRGFAVNMWNRSPEKVLGLKRLGNIRLSGEVKGSGVPSLVTNDMSSAVRDAEVVMIAVPASGHRDIAAGLAPHLHDGQTVVLNPGRTGGALAFRANLERAGCRADVTVAETNTFVYASRTLRPGHSHVYGVKERVSLAALPAMRTMDVLRKIRPAFPQFVPAENVLATGLDNMGAIFHPVPVLLNVTRVERCEEYEHYTHGISPSVARFLERLDSERVAVALALGVAVRSAVRWLSDTYGVPSGTGSLYGAVQANGAYRGILAPQSLKTRYIFEDVPYSLVSIAHIAELAGVETPVTRSVILLAEGLTGQDFWGSGRDAAEMGIDGMNAKELLDFVKDGASA